MNAKVWVWVNFTNICRTNICFDSSTTRNNQACFLC